MPIKTQRRKNVCRHCRRPRPGRNRWEVENRKKQRIASLINERQQKRQIPRHMEEFRLGGVQSGLTIRCHMVSLIAVFHCDREVHGKRDGWREKKETGAKVLIVFYVASSGFQRLPNWAWRECIAHFMVSGDLWNMANLKTSVSLLRGGVKCVNPIRLQETFKGD